MDELRSHVGDEELDELLRDLARYVVLPRADDLVPRVRAGLLAEASSGPRRATWRASWWARRGRRALIVLAACLALAALVVAVSPLARAALTRFFALPGVEITRLQPGKAVPPVVGGTLHLGTRTTLAAARGHVSFSIAIPHFGVIAQPDEVYVGDSPPGQISLVYHARAGFPRAAGTGVGLLITEFRASINMIVFKKLLAPDTRLDAVRMPGARGVWLSGAPHFFGYATGNGDVILEPLRFAGTTLLWERGGVTYRLEGSLTRYTAERIAESMR